MVVWFVWCVYVHVCGVCMHEHVCVYVYLSWWLSVSSPSWQKLENLCDQVSHSVAARPLYTDTAVWKAEATASSSLGKHCCFPRKVILFGWILFLFMFWAQDVAFGRETSKVFTIRAQPSIRVTINLQLDGRLQTTSIQCWRCKGRATLPWRSGASSLGKQIRSWVVHNEWKLVMWTRCECQEIKGTTNTGQVLGIVCCKTQW